MKIIAVSQRVDTIPSRGERRDSLDQRLVSFLKSAGFVSIPISNRLLLECSTSSEGILGNFMAHISPSALLLSGGNDLGEFSDRDNTEKLLLDYAELVNLPVLGVCRGMQMMATRSGAQLMTVSGHINSRHRITGKIVREVNSYHHYGFYDWPSDYEVLSKSADGVIKAIRHLNLPWEGWMWHPEREEEYSTEDVERLQKLVEGYS